MYKAPIAMFSLLLLLALPALAGWDEGVAAFTAKNYQQAVTEFQQVVQQNPESSSVHYMLGESLQRLGRKEEALNHLRKAYDLNPNDLNTKLSLGRSYTSLRRYGDAAQLLGSVDPSSLPKAQKAAFYQIRGQARASAKDEEGAASDLAQLAKLRPDDAKVQYLYGATALSVNRTDDAVAALGKAAQLAPRDADMKRAYISALIRKARESRDKATKKQNYSSAAEQAGKLVAINASYDNLLLACEAQLGAGQWDAAAKSGEAAIAKNSSNWLPYFYVGQAYTSAGAYGKTEEPLRTALNKTSKPSEIKQIWKQLGFNYEKQKKYSEAVTAYQNAGDASGVARVKKNEETAAYNEQVEEENKAIQQMESEAKRLEEELKKLESGGGS